MQVRVQVVPDPVAYAGHHYIYEVHHFDLRNTSVNRPMRQPDLGHRISRQPCFSSPWEHPRPMRRSRPESRSRTDPLTPEMTRLSAPSKFSEYSASSPTVTGPSIQGIFVSDVGRQELLVATSALLIILHDFMVCSLS
jgi:hypothetical protein